MILGGYLRIEQQPHKKIRLEKLRGGIYPVVDETRVNNNDDDPLPENLKNFLYTLKTIPFCFPA